MTLEKPAGKPRTPKRTRGRPRLGDAAQIEDELLKSALSEFLAHGYGGASINRIVKTAGVSKSTLYSRYPSKDELFRAIIHRQLERLAIVTTLTAGAAPDLASGLKAYAKRSLAISLNGDVLAINRLIYAESHRFPELGMVAAERSRLGVAQITWFIEECCRRQSAPCSNAATVAEAFIMMQRGWYVNAMLADRALSDEECAAWVERMVDLLLASRASW